METHIIRQPILGREMKLEAYELVYYQDASTLYNQRDSRVASAIIDFFAAVGAEGFFEGMDCFVTFTPNLLMQDIPYIFDVGKLVIQIEENILINPEAKAILRRYKQQGYRIAAMGFDFNKRYLDLLPDVDIIKVDFTQEAPEGMEAVCALAKRFGKQLAAYGITSEEAKAKALAYGCDYLQGEAVSGSITEKVRKADFLESNIFRLMAAVSVENPDFDEISQIISMDVSLSYGILRMVNSAYYALPNKVGSVKHALNILGQNKLRQWIYLMSFSDNGGVGDQIIKQSFLRAVFCQGMHAHIPDLPISRAEAYLLGMFSTLEALLDVPVAQALESLPLSIDLKLGLSGSEGRSAELLRLCDYYEKALWRQAAVSMGELQVSERVVGKTYMDAVAYVNEVWAALPPGLN